MLFLYKLLNEVKKTIIISVLISCFLTSLAQNSGIPFTLEDRDRIIRTEQEIKSLRNEMNIKFDGIDIKFDAMNAKFESMDAKFDTKFESQQQQINDLKESIRDIKVLLLWGFGILFSLFLFMLGYMIWDRRTALIPIQKITMSLKEKVANLENILKKEAATNMRLAETLRTYGLL